MTVTTSKSITQYATSEDRYTGPGRRGRSRSLTPYERRAWIAATQAWDERHTKEAKAANERVMKMLVRRYEDGVSLPALAEAAGWGHARVAGILHRAKNKSMTTGSRRFIPAPSRPEKAPYRRNLTSAEYDVLTDLYQALPVLASGYRSWKGEEADALLAELDRLANDKVTLDNLGAALGMTRQAMHLRLNTYRDSLVAA